MKAAIIFFLCVAPIWGLSISPRIIGGQDALPGEFPYAAIVYKTASDGSYFCSGSLINDQWILTAGQCVQRGLSFSVRLGSYTLGANPYDTVIAQSNTSVLHPDFNAETLANDIGLIKLNEPVASSTYIQHLYLPSEDPADGTNVVVYGWGQTSDTDDELSPTLRYVTLTLVPDDECRLTYGDQITETMACFKGTDNDGPCYGDSGSPAIQHTQSGRTEIVAISSFFSGNGCESTDPSGYTRIFPYNDWINDTVNGSD